jgi:hypothetical protein
LSERLNFPLILGFEWLHLTDTILNWNSIASNSQSIVNTIQNKEDLLRVYSDVFKESSGETALSPRRSYDYLIEIKKGGSLRPIVDYQMLNAITIKNCCPLPLILNLMDQLSEAKIFTCLDLFRACHLVSVHPDSQHLTAFRTCYGHFKYQVIPFGLCNAPAVF